MFHCRIFESQEFHIDVWLLTVANCLFFSVVWPPIVASCLVHTFLLSGVHHEEANKHHTRH